MEDLFSTYGQVKAPLRVSSEMRQIDIWFDPQVPPGDLQPLGLLGRMAQTTAILEPFRNPATPEEICSCLLKALELRAEQQRQAERNTTKHYSATIPTLWVLTPTASASLLKGFRAQEEDAWSPGLYFLADTLKTTIVAIHQLPRTPETLWLRLLGRGRVQLQAIDELETLPTNHPFRSKALELVLNLQQNLEARQDKDPDDRELIMRLSPLYSQKKEQSRQQGLQQGIQQGLQQGIQQGTQMTQRIVVETLLKSRFGTIDRELERVVNAIEALSSEAFAASLAQLNTLSREDLLVQFPTTH